TGDAQAGSRSAFIVPLTAGNWAHRDPREGRGAPRDESRCRETREETLGSANLSTKRQRIAELARTKAGTALSTLHVRFSTGESRSFHPAGRDRRRRVPEQSGRLRPSSCSANSALASGEARLRGPHHCWICGGIEHTKQLAQLVGTATRADLVEDSVLHLLAH